MHVPPGEVYRLDNVIRFPLRISSWSVNSLLRELDESQRAGHKQFSIDMGAVRHVFPNGLAPFAGIFEFYKNQRGLTFELNNAPYLGLTPLNIEPTDILDGSAIHHPLGRVWRFSRSTQVSDFVKAFVLAVAQAAECENGVLMGMEWCLYEVMDNVLNHSSSHCGYVMGQIHQKKKHIALCVYDHGRGIYNSLKSTEHAPANPSEAIKISMNKGVTRDKEIGQGYGMWGLHNIVLANSGQLRITSGSGFYEMNNGTPRHSNTVPFLDREHNCTTVDFQIDFSKGISLPNALEGYEPPNIRVQDLPDENNTIVYKVAEKRTGVGTRESGKALRAEVWNLMKESDASITVDFGGLGVVASSFADEFLGKLAVRVGVEKFMQRIRVTGMTPTVRVLVEGSLDRRLEN